FRLRRVDMGMVMVVEKEKTWFEKCVESLVGLIADLLWVHVSLLPANSPTTNLPLATTTNLPPAISTTTNLPPATSTTSHLFLEISTTSHLPPATSSTSHLLPLISTARACNINEADLFVVPVVGEENLLIGLKYKNWMMLL
nr:hypothetical protein [Tanacetum cinerariifolium]